MTRLALALPLLALLGCPTKDLVMCTDIAIASVVVNVSTASGDPVEADVTYSSDGETFEACEPFADGDQFVCGYEVAGELTIRVAADGYSEVEELVLVEADECHVISETLDVTLEPLPE